jgi:ferredoxin
MENVQAETVMEIPDLPSILDAETAKRIKSYPQHVNRASSIGHPCTRFLVLSRVAGEKKELHDVGLQRIFDEGNIQEAAVVHEMEAARVSVLQRQRPYEWRRFQLTGQIDGLIKVNGLAVPFDIKSCSPNTFRTIKKCTSGDDLIKSKYSWVRKYPAQILGYMMMEGAEYGFILFKDKSTGEKHQINFRLDGETLRYTEEILQKLEKVNAHVAAGTVPDAVRIEDCRGCGFCKTACFVGQDFGPGYEMLLDADEIEAKLDRREELAAARSEYEEIDEEIKDAFKGRTAVVGAWMIESRPYETTSYNVPKEVKAQYAEKKVGYRAKIERI